MKLRAPDAAHHPAFGVMRRQAGPTTLQKWVPAQRRTAKRRCTASGTLTPTERDAQKLVLSLPVPLPEIAMPVVTEVKPLAIVFADDGLVPNNPLPFLVYKGAVDVANDHPEKTIEGLFGANGWGQMWRNGVFDYLHYHATVHEVLGIARGNARVRFGGDKGRELEISAGDVAILPAGTGHQCISSSEDFCVVGAYPPGPPMQITRPTPENHAKAL